MELQLDIDTEEKFRLLGMQAVAHDDGVILKRGTARVMLKGTDVPQLLALLVDSDDGSGFTVEQVKSRLAAHHWDLLDEVITVLRERRLITRLEQGTQVTRGDTAEDVFYWDFNTTSKTVRGRLDRLKIPVFGVNDLSLALVSALKSCGFNGAYVVDHPALRGLNLSAEPPADAVSFDDWVDDDAFDDAGIIVVCSDFGGLDPLREWNDFCVAENKEFMPVVLQDHVAYIGPIVVPQRTPCFECLWSRQNSNLGNPVDERATEKMAFFGQHATGTLAPFVGAAANIAASELLKHFSQALPGETVGRMVELHQLEPAIHQRKFAKAPFCRVCSPTRSHSATATERNVFMPGNEIQDLPDAQT